MAPMTLDLMNGIAASAALLLSTIAAWMLHRRVRTRSSTGLAWSTTAMCLWPFVSTPAMAAVAYYSGNALAEEWANALWLASEQIIPMLLTLTTAVFFLLAVRGVAYRNAPAQ